MFGCIYMNTSTIQTGVVDGMKIDGKNNTPSKD